jgi:hypothetical protein
MINDGLNGRTKPRPARDVNRERREAIKDCIRRNEHVAITLYRDFAPAAINTQPSASSNLPYFQDRLPLRVVNH